MVRKYSSKQEEKEMTTKYIKPETLVVTIHLSNLLMLSSGGSESGEQNLGVGFNQEIPATDPDPGEFEEGEFARNNRGNVWDNIW